MTVAAIRRPALALAVALGALVVPLPVLHAVAWAADPSATEAASASTDPSTPAPSAAADPSTAAPSAAPQPTPARSSPDPTATASPSPSASSSPSPSPAPSASGSPAPTPSGSPPPGPSPSPDPSPTPTPPPTPSPTPSVPRTLNLYSSRGFRYQDPNYSACTATSAQDMLNFIALAGSGGDGFRWHVTLSGTVRDAILRFERSHDTLTNTARGTDPHGWRNALNYYGWGAGDLQSSQQVYKDVSYSSYSAAIHAAVRQLILTRKPVGILGWAGQHAQMLTGYDGLVGNPLAKNPDGSWADRFSVAVLYITDPLRADATLNRRVGYATLATTSNLRLRFRAYMQYDSRYDDSYTPGWRVARLEWYRRFTLLLPVR